MLEREKQLEDMIEFANVDGEFVKAELELITVVAERLGFTKTELDQFIRSKTNR